MADEATNSPAAVADAPPPEPAPESPAPTAPATAAATVATEPDYESLLSDDKKREALIDRLLKTPDGRKQLLGHPDLTKEVDHRARSVRDADIQSRIQAALSAERTRNEAENATRLKAQEETRKIEEQRRLIEEDPTSPLAQHLKPQLAQRERDLLFAEARQAAAQEILPTLRENLHREAGNYWLDMLKAQVQADDSLTDEERAGLDPRGQQWKTPDEFFKAWLKASTDRRARIIAKELAKVEAKAMVEEQLAQGREKATMPPALPAGDGALSDKDFMAEFAAGKNNDFARAQRLMSR